MQNEPDLKSAYALETPDDSRKLYAAWAKTYDEGFVQQSGYILHEHVVRQFTIMGGFGPVLDIGAGTGLCGEALRARGIEPVDGTDISAEMLAIACEKNIYRNLFTGDVVKGLEVNEDTYQGAVSAGTFTMGHVGPNGIDTILHAVRPNGWIVFSVNAKHYQTAGFSTKMTGLVTSISDFSTVEVPIYAPDVTQAHAKDTALILAFRKS